ncbi:hypothetical protein [Sandaracinus amylolyticus]|uniref:hypothetical protein n=1 Tax=Sandaracinus amylolyticus TaxID=927083 RepID=UPI001F374B8C|nr:hypothetical protein [Sandaracinus amylolyticus]UJR82700.1 Hypothetical protein I5071_47650 [Sandaracinus amylolyticus]
MRGIVVGIAAIAIAACSHRDPSPRPRAPVAVHEERVTRRDEPAPPVHADAPAPARRELGPLPGELASLRWPEAPRITRTVDVHDAASLQRAVDEPGTCARVHGAIEGAITVHASDVEILMSEGARLGRVTVVPGTHRVRVSGGTIDGIELSPPARWNPEPAYDEALMITDVLIERVRAEASDSAFVIRGRRVAIVDADVRAERYSLWAGDTGPLDGEDLIVAGNTFRSAGPESTLRIHDVARSVVVDNVLSNGRKHDYRVHGRSDLAYAARNVLLRTGIMIGNQPGDAVGSVVLERNTLYLEEPSMLEIDEAAIRRLVLRDNVVYTDRWDTFYPYPRVREGWIVEHNERHPFRPYVAER